jgi:ABC-type branched-subunit amino acid transport system substrate-binding protein
MAMPNNSRGGLPRVHVTVSHRHRKINKNAGPSGEECTMLQGKWLTAFFGLVLAIAGSGQTLAQATIKVAYTDPLSGPFAQVGDANLKQMQYIIDHINAKGGALGKKFELVPFDNKSQPSDALIALKSATDQNMPFIMQCSGSNIAATASSISTAARWRPSSPTSNAASGISASTCMSA